jgi:hypothetical protein
MPFTYRIRSKEQWDARAAGGGDFESWLKNEYRMYKPLNNENCIRILPPLAWEDAPHYGMSVWVHYGVGPDNASVICLFKMNKGDCPICQDRVRAERAKDEEKMRRTRPARRVVVFLINKKDEGQGPLAWAMPQTLDQAITKVAKDRTTGQYYFVDHHEEGYDVYFDKEGESLNTKYTGVSLAKRASAVPEVIVEWAAEHAIPDCLHWRDYDEVNRLYMGAGRGEAPDEAPTRPAYPERRTRRNDTPRGDNRGLPIDDAPRQQMQEPLDNGGRSRPDAEAPPWDAEEPPVTRPTATAPPPNGASGKTRAEQLRALANARKIDK